MDNSRWFKQSEKKFVLNVVAQDMAEVIVLDIGRILKPGGKALIITRAISDVKSGAKAYIHPKYGELSWGVGEKVTSRLTYQKGFNFKTLSELVSSVLPAVTIERHRTTSGVCILISK